MAVLTNDAVQLHLVDVYLALVVSVSVVQFCPQHKFVVALGLAAVGNLQLAAGDVAARPLLRVSRPVSIL